MAPGVGGSFLFKNPILRGPQPGGRVLFFAIGSDPEHSFVDPKRSSLSWLAAELWPSTWLALRWPPTCCCWLAAEHSSSSGICMGSHLAACMAAAGWLLTWQLVGWLLPGSERSCNLVNFDPQNTPSKRETRGVRGKGASDPNNFVLSCRDPKRSSAATCQLHRLLVAWPGLVLSDPRPGGRVLSFR